MHYPKFTQVENWNEKAMFFVITIGPLLSLSQVYNVWFLSKEGVSATTWVGFFITQIAFMIHSIKINDKINIVGGYYG